MALVFLALWTSQVVRSGWCLDECAHIPAGLYHLETGRMDAYKVNPPLPRMIAAVPLLIDQPRMKWYYFESPMRRNEFRFGHDWLTNNPISSTRRQLILARVTVLLFVAIGVWAIVRWTSQLYGYGAAALAATLWLMNPDVITHSAVVAPDLPAASAGLLVGYLFWNWLRSADRPVPWDVAIALAFAILCKFSWLFLVVALPVITLLHDCLGRYKQRAQLKRDHPERTSRPAPQRDTCRLLASFLLTLLIINFNYGFQGTGSRLGEFRFLSPTLGGDDKSIDEDGNRFAGTILGKVPVPLPEQMVLGLDFLRWEFEKKLECYLRGEWKLGGWWYFHLYAMGVKIPLGYWLLIGIGAGWLIWDLLRGYSRAELEWLPLFFAIAFVALISSQTGFTHHVRYVLPAYGFLFIVASRSFILLPKRIAIALAMVCLVGTAWFHTVHIGLAHTFFNPLAGGPNHGWRHLSYSNVDWGQSSYRMADWVKQHPEHRPIYVVFPFFFGDPGQLVDGLDQVTTGFRARPRSASTPPRWCLISSFRLTYEDKREFWNQQPAARPYPDVLLYRIGD